MCGCCGHDERDDYLTRQPLRYDPNFNGPQKNRSCTDIVCLLIFIIFLGCWGAVGWYAITRGDPSTLLVPRDSKGQRCGLDPDVSNRSFLFFFDLTQCFSPTTPFTGCPTEQVCVESCPDKNFFAQTATQAEYDAAVKFCSYGTRKYDSKKCPSWYLSSESVLNRCLYNVANRRKFFEKFTWEKSLSTFQGDEISIMKDYLNPVHLWMSLAVHNGISIFRDDEKVHEVAENIVKDIMVSWWKIAIGVVIALFCCLIYIFILRWIAAPMVWLSIFGVVAALVAGTYFTTVEYIDYKDKFENPDLEEEKPSNKVKKDLWLMGLVVMAILLGIILLVLIFLRKRIGLAIQLIKEASRAVSSVTSSLFFPIFPWILQVGVIAYAVCTGLYLATTGEAVYKMRMVTEGCKVASAGVIANGTICIPGSNFSSTKSPYDEACANATCRFIYMENENIYYYLQGINVFGFFWLAFFVSAMGQMILAQVFAQWYWTFKKRNLPFFALTSAVYRTLRYHIGTLAFGSLIIAICRMIRVALEYVDKKCKKYDNEITKAILCCCKCFFWCLEKFLKFINKNAYIMCAIHGKGFCGSARDAFMLLMRNIIRVFVLDKVTDFLFFLSKVLVTVGVGAVAYVFFASDLLPTSVIDNSSLNYGGVPVVIIMIATYLISSLFFSVYSMAVDTLFLCFLEDCERNDGSAEKPYFMSKSLMTIFGKRNKIKKY